MEAYYILAIVALKFRIQIILISRLKYKDTKWMTNVFDACALTRNQLCIDLSTKDGMVKIDPDYS